MLCLSSGCGGSSRTAAKPPAPRAKDAKGFHCLKANLDSLGRCPANPNFGKTRAQVRAAAVAKAKAARRARIAKAAAARRAGIAAARAAAQERARIAAANAWHQGYYQQDANVYYRLTDRSCEAYAEQGCWHVEVITRDGCASYLAVQANEYQGGTIINSLLDNQGFGVPAKTPRVFELDADQPDATINDVTIDCS